MSWIDRALVTLVDAARKLQSLQVSVYAGDPRDDVEHFEPYGLTSHPKSGAEALVLSVGGSADHSVVVQVSDRRYRLRSLAEGEVALYDDQGQRVILKRGGIEIVAPKGATVSGDLAVTGAVSAGNGATGSFLDKAGQTVTVADGIVTSIGAPGA